MSARHALLLLTAASQPRVAHTAALRPSQWVLGHWDTTEGLPEATVQTLARTADGYLWLGTEDGLARFDGVRFTLITHATQSSLPDNYISALYADRRQRLWIGTHGGISRIENGAMVSASGIPGLAHADVRAFAEDRLGTLWIGTRTGLISIDPATNAQSDRSSTLHDDRIQALCVDAAGVLWVGTGAGLERFDGTNFQRIGLDGDMDASITAILAETDGTLWVGTGTGALYRRVSDHFVMAIAPGHLGSEIKALTRDRDRRLWIGLQGGGLFRESAGEFSRFADNRFSESDALALLQDPEGNLWVGSGNGLWRLREPKFPTWGEPEGLPGRVAWTIAPRGPGGLWVGTDGGLSIFSDDRLRNLPAPAGFEKFRVRSVLEDRGDVFVGTQGAGMYHFDSSTLKIAPRIDGIRGRSVYALCKDRVGQVWVGTDEGLFIINNGSAASATGRLGITGKTTVRIIHEDAIGGMWIATETDGLFLLGETTVRRFTTADGLPHDWVTAIDEDERGVIWLGTANGLALWRNGRILSLAPFGSPLNDFVAAVVEDDTHRLWISQSHGLTAISRTEVDALVDHNKKTF